MVKEEIFRKYDVNPLDGILSLEEVRAAYNTHDVDTGYLNYLEMNTTVFTSTRGGLLLSAVMKSPQKPFALHRGRVKRRICSLHSKSHVPNLEKW